MDSYELKFTLDQSQLASFELWIESRQLAWKEGTLY